MQKIGIKSGSVILIESSSPVPDRMLEDIEGVFAVLGEDVKVKVLITQPGSITILEPQT